MYLLFDKSMRMYESTGPCIVVKYICTSKLKVQCTDITILKLAIT